MIIKTKESAHLLFAVDLKSTTFSCCQICLHSLLFLEVMKDILCLTILNIIALILFEVMLILAGCLHLQCANIISDDVHPDLLICNLKQMQSSVSVNFPTHQYSCILFCSSIVILLFFWVPRHLDLNPHFSGLSHYQVNSLKKLPL